MRFVGVFMAVFAVLAGISVAAILLGAALATSRDRPWAAASWLVLGLVAFASVVAGIVTWGGF